MIHDHTGSRTLRWGAARRAAAVLSAGLLATFLGLGGCSDDNNGVSPTDTTPPTVQSVTPADGATGVPVNTTIEVVFSEPILASSVTATTFSMQGSQGTLTVNGAKATFTPAAFFDPNVEQTCTVTTGVKDLAGNAMASDYSWSFTTGAQPVADAGNDVDVNIGESIFLDGTGSFDPDGSPLASYTWTQVQGPTVTVVSGNTAHPEIQNAPTTVATLGFQLVVSTVDEPSQPDLVTVRILEDKNHQLWVAPSGDDANLGTRAAPMLTIQAAIDASAQEGLGADVYVAAGGYTESLTLADGVSLYGGFDETDWTRDLSLNDTVIQGGPRAVYVNGAGDLTIDGFTILAADGAVSGESSVAIGLTESIGVAITRNRLTAGLGMDGAIGGGGSNGIVGPAGSDASGRYGGAPGNGPGHDGGYGGTSDLTSGSSGGTGQGPVGGYGGNGAGMGGNGSPGGPGGNGTDGGHGVGGPAFGGVAFGGYLAGNGAPGGTGGNGCGGGGGGAGGGVLFANGGGGGGGGAGGTGGTGGIGGGGGGGSFGILVTDGSQVVIVDNVITTADGGNGAMGGKGAPGGAGGPGGNGRSVSGAGNGADGGIGGNGGIGGDGGGGAGGPSYGIVEDAGSTSNVDNDTNPNTITFGTPGIGATGPGGAGSDATAGEYMKL